MFGATILNLATTLTDSYLHIGRRRQLISNLRSKGIEDEAVLDAMFKVPRHWFLSPASQHLAYEDRPLPILSAQTISQPFTVARQVSLLEAQPGMKVLEVGTGSGYQAAVLAAFGLRVYTVERFENLYKQAKSILIKAKYRSVKCFLQDGSNGMPAYSPYDRIIVAAGAKEIPTVLLDQLKVGGKLVIPVGLKEQRMLRLTKVSSTEITKEDFGQFKFVPFQEGVVRTKLR